jgi:hypothetical protein
MGIVRWVIGHVEGEGIARRMSIHGVAVSHPSDTP